MGRFIAALLAGLAVYFVVDMSLEVLGHQLYPAAQSVNFNDPEVLKSYMNNLPIAAKLYLLATWSTASMAGGFTSGAITRIKHTLAAVIIGIFAVCSVIAITMMIPHPTWMTIVGLIAPIPFALLGSKLAKRH